jgi:hypothetical protein
VVAVYRDRQETGEQDAGGGMNAPAAFKATREVWRSIAGFSGLYEVSNLGRVRSIDRTVKTKRGVDQRWKGKLLKIICGDGRYPSVALSKCGVEKTFMVHSLVARAFIGECPQGYEVCHNDGSKTNARADNLRYDTRANNHADKISHGTSLRGERNAQAKLSKEDIAEIISLRGVETQRKIAAKFGVTQSNISCIFLGKSWRHS